MTAVLTLDISRSSDKYGPLIDCTQQTALIAEL